MGASLDQIANLVLEIVQLLQAARSCPSYDEATVLTRKLRDCGERLAKLAPEFLDEISDRVLRKIMDAGEKVAG